MSTVDSFFAQEVNRMHNANAPISSNPEVKPTASAPVPSQQWATSYYSVFKDHISNITLPDFEWTVFEDSQWTDEQVSRIPKEQNLVLDNEQLYWIAKALQDGSQYLLLGSPGTGKSSLIKQLAHKRNQPLTRINGYADMDSGTIIGTETLKAGNISYKYGVFSQAFRDGELILVDEVDRIPAEIKFVLQSAFERDGELLLPNAEGNNSERLVKRPSTLRIISTANSLGFGDRAGIIAGEGDISQIDRLDRIFEITYLTPKHEKQALRNKFPKASVEFIIDLITLAGRTRKHYNAGDLILGITFRSLAPILEDLAIYSNFSKKEITTAVSTCYKHKIPQTEWPQIDTLVDDVFDSVTIYYNVS